jgi:hypothetical protein
MKDDQPSHDTVPARGTTFKKAGVLLLRGFLWLILVFLLLILIATVIQPLSVLLEVPLRLGVGWAFHLQHTLPEIRWSMEMIVSGVSAVFLAAFSLNYVASRLYAKASSKVSAWSWRATAGVTLGVAVLFGSAICGAGIVHQISWLMRSEWITDGFSGRLFGPDANKARQLVMLAKSLGTQAGGYLPEHLKDLQNFMEEPDDIQPLLIPKTQNGEVPEPWIYLGSRLPTNAPGWLPVLVQPRPMKMRGQNLRVVFSLDGESKALNEEEYQVLLSRWRGYLKSQPTTKA